MYNGTDYWFTDHEILRLEMWRKSDRIPRFLLLPIFLTLLALFFGLLLSTSPPVAVLITFLLSLVTLFAVSAIKRSIETKLRRDALDRLSFVELLSEAYRIPWSKVRYASLSKGPVQLGEWGRSCLLTLDAAKLCVPWKDFGAVGSFIHSRIGERLQVTLSEVDQDSGVRGISWQTPPRGSG